MASVFKLPPTVTDQIMRFAIGYPSDRLRAITADVVRTSWQTPSSKTVVDWNGPGRGDNWLSGIFRLVWDNDREWQMERDREVEMLLLQEQCEACEPAELQLQRTYF